MSLMRNKRKHLNWLTVLTSGPMAFLVSLALTAACLSFVSYSFAPDSLVYRYLCGHPVEYAETWMFFWALTTLGARAVRLAKELKTVPATTLHSDCLGELPDSLFRRRLEKVLAYCSSEPDQQSLELRLQELAQSDQEELDQQRGLLRFLIWAIPILGFLGTVLGITEAIEHVSPEQLAQSINAVTAGLAVAFDTTALALAYSIALMFFSFALDRSEYRLLATIDAAVRRVACDSYRQAAPGHVPWSDLVHRLRDLFDRQGVQWEATNRSLLNAWDKQAKLWADHWQSQMQAAADAWSTRLHQEIQTAAERITAALHNSLEPVACHLAEYVQGLDRSCNLLSEHIGALRHMAVQTHHLAEAEQRLRENLELLSVTQTLEQTLQALAAAVHVLSARSAPTSGTRKPFSGPLDQGQAA
ncbi:MAG: hypothetical protein C4297_00375 [Gemmataceae bacterium]